MNSGLGYKSPSLLPSKGQCCDKSKSKRVEGFKEKRKRGARKEIRNRIMAVSLYLPQNMLYIDICRSAAILQTHCHL
jgi:hypothetical protein